MLPDSYVSVAEALKHAGAACGLGVQIWINLYARDFLICQL